MVLAFVPSFIPMIFLRAMSGFFMASLRPVCNALVADAGQRWHDRFAGLGRRGMDNTQFMAILTLNRWISVLLFIRVDCLLSSCCHRCWSQPWKCWRIQHGTFSRCHVLHGCTATCLSSFPHSASQNRFVLLTGNCFGIELGSVYLLFPDISSIIHDSLLKFLPYDIHISLPSLWVLHTQGHDIGHQSRQSLWADAECLHDRHVLHYNGGRKLVVVVSVHFSYSLANIAI